MSETEDTESTEEPEGIAFSEFLERIPPSSSFTKIADLTGTVYWESIDRAVEDTLLTPDIQLHCPNDACNGTRFFRCSDSNPIKLSYDLDFLHITYVCSNCRKTTKKFSLAFQGDMLFDSREGLKLGEYPAYGPPTPSRLITLLGPDRELFLKGRNCENQGLGIGAFVYYRRVVEHQKNRILDEIIKVSRKFNVKPEIIATLEAAKTETQFSKALASVKNAMPQALLINGHNPLTLLHAALSDGLHERSDQECLEIAGSVRVVLAELSERLSQALKDEAELNHALSKLMGIKKK